MQNGLVFRIRGVAGRPVRRVEVRVAPDLCCAAVLLPRSLVLAICLCCLACASGPPKVLQEVEGEVARVQVIRAYRFNWQTEEAFRSKDGLGFELLVHRKPEARGSLRSQFTVLVNGRPYGPGHHPTLPRTASSAVRLVRLSDYRFPDGRSARETLGRDDDGAYVLLLMVPGAALPLFGRVELILQGGWDEFTESMSLRFFAEDIDTGEPTP